MSSPSELGPQRRTEAEPDFQTRLIAPARRLHDNAVIGADVNDVVVRLLLFNNYILDSTRLLEIPQLVSAFGADGLIELLQRGVLQIRCEPLVVGQIGQTTILREDNGLLPPCCYAFRYVKVAKYEDYIHRCLQPLHTIPGLKHKVILRLKRAIVSSLVRLPAGFFDSIQGEMTEEFRASPSLLRAAFDLELGRRFGTDVANIPIKFRFDEIGPGDFRVESDLSINLNISINEVHNIGMAAGFAVATLVQRLAEMKTFSALTGFSETDVALARSKFEFLARAIIPDVQERRFTRVMQLSGFPDFRLEWNERTVNVHKLLDVRDSDECRVFREWLRSTDILSDKQISDLVAGLRAKLGTMANNLSGKAFRFLASSAIAVYGGLPSLIAGFIDSFIVDKVFPKKGIISFVSRQYPSIFEYPKESLLSGEATLVSGINQRDRQMRSELTSSACSVDNLSIKRADGPVGSGAV